MAVPTEPAVKPSTHSDTTTIAIATQSRARRRSLRTATPSTAVTTRLALMMVCARNRGISRAETTLPRKPTPSSTMPARNAGVSAALKVSASDGAPVAGVAPARGASPAAALRAP